MKLSDKFVTSHQICPSNEESSCLFDSFYGARKTGKAVERLGTI